MLLSDRVGGGGGREGFALSLVNCCLLSVSGYAMVPKGKSKARQTGPISEWMDVGFTEHTTFAPHIHTPGTSSRPLVIHTH